VAALAAQGRFEHILVESTGIGEPLPVAAAFAAADSSGRVLADVASLDSMVRNLSTCSLLGNSDERVRGSAGAKSICVEATCRITVCHTAHALTISLHLEELGHPRVVSVPKPTHPLEIRETETKGDSCQLRRPVHQVTVVDAAEFLAMANSAALAVEAAAPSAAGQLPPPEGSLAKLLVDQASVRPRPCACVVLSGSAAVWKRSGLPGFATQRLRRWRAVIPAAPAAVVFLLQESMPAAPFPLNVESAHRMSPIKPYALCFRSSLQTPSCSTSATWSHRRSCTR